MYDDIICIFGSIALIVISLAIDIAIVSAAYYILCWCFGLVFSWKVALGVWIVIILLKNTVLSGRKEK